MLNTKLITAINNFNTQTILVIGDVMLDTYYTGKVNRISPEAPVPILDLETITHKLGGAANVALNTKKLGARTLLLSVIGNDDAGQKLTQLVKEHAIEAYLTIEETRLTTQKIRYIAQQNQLLRVDSEQKTTITTTVEQQLLATFLSLINTNTLNAVIIEDYNKGLLSATLITAIITACNHACIKVLVDPKKDNFFEYKNVTVFKPNLKELIEATQLKMVTDSSIKKAAETLRNQINAKLLMVTMADRGILICSEKETQLVAAQKRSVADVSGAGDTVIATVALTITQLITYEEIAALSNLAGGAVCEQMGVVPIYNAELIAQVQKNKV